MKLSDIKGERVFDVIADLTEPVASIAADKDAASLFESQAVPKGVEPRDFVIARLKRSLPKLMRGHKADLVAILATLKGVSPEEYLEGMTMATLLNDVVELMNDEEFVAFLS